MKDKLNITIRIADLPPFRIVIAPEEEEIVRKAQKNVNLLWQRWSERFTDNTPGQILGMVAYRFAQMFYTAEAQIDEINSVADDLEASLNQFLLDAGTES